jgi:glutamine amidotransferase
MIAIIDYGGGNIGSVKNALDYLDIDNIITDDPDLIRKSYKIILPGQGRFGDVMDKLGAKGLAKLLINEMKKGKPYLGICIGLQILFERGEEDPEIKGLGVLKGDVPRFKISQKVPQIGWNRVRIKRKTPLFNGIPDNSFFYFVHSYYADPDNQEDILTSTDYGNRFASGIKKNNIFAVQFHPEKSGENGLKLLKNFGDLQC